MEARRVGGCEGKGLGMQSESIACGSEEENVNLPFPVPPKGKAGAGGFPPRRQKTAAPPARGQAPLARSPGGTIADFVVDGGRPSHGSRDREEAVFNIQT